MPLQNIIKKLFWWRLNNFDSIFYNDILCRGVFIALLWRRFYYGVYYEDLYFSNIFYYGVKKSYFYMRFSPYWYYDLFLWTTFIFVFLFFTTTKTGFSASDVARAFFTCKVFSSFEKPILARNIHHKKLIKLIQLVE